MRWKQYIDPEEVKKAIRTLQAPGKVFEVRVVGASAGRKSILSGYFRDADTLLEQFDAIDVRGRNIYITLGEVKEECFSRSQSEHFEQNPSTTSDPEIVRYRWLFVDLDPVRPAGISSSDAEMEKARVLSHKVLSYMEGIGFPAPVIAMSGNGYHLLYRINVDNNEAGRHTVEKCLKNLASMFDTDAVKIDTTNSNPSRICKLHGTLAQKGTSTADRPHRMSGIIQIPARVEMASEATLLRLVEELPDEPIGTTRKRTTLNQGFDLVGFLHRNGLTYSEDNNDRAKIFRLDHCPFDHNHKDGDAKVFQYPDGAIAFKCHHNSCRQYKWQDVRLKFEPDAYSHDDDDQRIDEGYRQHKQKVEQERSQGSSPAPEEPKPKKERTFRKLKTAEALMLKDIPEPKVFIGVGEDVPLLVEGTCILSAKPKLGKSWLALAMCLAVAKGEDFLGYKTEKCSTLYLDLETSESLQQKRLGKMLQGEMPPKNFYLETETDKIENGFIDQIENYLEQDANIGIVVIDVFQIIRSSAKSIKETEYEHAYRDITPLNELAQKHHISIILVCHDRKAVDEDDPFSNILGSTGLQGAATQMMVMFKKKKDDPIHISVKGKTIDGLPELNVKLENAQWSIVAAGDAASRERAEADREYWESEIRRAVVAIMQNYEVWKGRCSTLIEESVKQHIPITGSPKEVGGFLHKHMGRFMAMDQIEVEVVQKGTASKMYKLTKLPFLTISTISDNETLPFPEWENADKINDFEIPFP